MIKIRKNLINKVKLALLLLFVFLLPTQLGKHFFFTFSYLSGIRSDYLAPTVYLIDLVTGLIFAFNFKYFISLLKTKTFWLLAGLAVFNSIFAYNYQIAIYRNLRLIQFFLVITIIRHQKLPPTAILIPIFISSVVQLLLSIYQIVNGESFQKIAYWFGERYLNINLPSIATVHFQGKTILRPYATFSHPNSLAGFYLLFYFYVLTEKRFRQLPLLRSLFLITATSLIMISFSKIAIITFAVLNFIYLIRSTKNTCRLCLVSNVIILIITSLVFLSFQSDPLSLNNRLQLLKNGWKVFLHRPLIGVGAGNYLIVQNQQINQNIHFLNQPVHNSFFLLFIEYGIIGVAWMLIIVRRSFRQFLLKAPFVLALVSITGSFDHYWLTLIQNFIALAFIFGSL